MAQIYNTSELLTGTNAAEWLLIINNWSGGLIIATGVIATALLVLGIMLKSDVPLEDALAATCFVMFLVSGLLWIIQFNGLRAMPTALVVVFGLFMALAVFFKVVRGWMQ